MSAKAPYKVLFICTGNSARSIIAEHILRVRGKGRFECYSAGSHPTGTVNPFTIEVLKKHFAIDASQARSKSWEEFRETKFDFVITVCDQARKSCPVWPGNPILAHWASPDPADFKGDHDKILQGFAEVATQINSRIGIFAAFRDAQLDEWEVRSVGEKFALPSAPATTK